MPEILAGKPRVFVVDHDQVTGAAYAKLLTWYGFKASFFYPFEALDAAHFSAPDLLIADAAMPGISGLDLAVLLRGICPECKVVLVVFPAMKDDMMLATRKAGHMFEFLTRPVVSGELVYAAQRMLELRPRASN
jgi:FixJ family two-component response regulator